MVKQKNKYSSADTKLNDSDRFRDFGIFRYWFRSVEKYAPWVGKIYLVTEGHLPDWINLNNERLVHVRHQDYIPEKYLPTFNSNVIELNLHRIKDLSESFVLFNDDLFFNAPVKSIDFFESDKAKDVSIYSPIPPHDEFSMIVYNDVRIINKYFSKKMILKKTGVTFFHSNMV
ncbi:hypothetical protein [Pediococcus argentinicus]|nr:hypothetical protein [Pediococcus argentinicus]NKZ22490.1 hypothetical protein [Pediococcus argentinicus]GEP20178.1 hypothetical protein LSA03_15620 [Pediococcus argentinicus]